MELLELYDEADATGVADGIDVKLVDNSYLHCWVEHTHLALGTDVVEHWGRRPVRRSGLLHKLPRMGDLVDRTLAHIQEAQPDEACPLEVYPGLMDVDKELEHLIYLLNQMLAGLDAEAFASHPLSCCACLAGCSQGVFEQPLPKPDPPEHLRLVACLEFAVSDRCLHATKAVFSHPVPSPPSLA